MVDRKIRKTVGIQYVSGNGRHVADNAVSQASMLSREMGVVLVKISLQFS